MQMSDLNIMMGFTSDGLRKLDERVRHRSNYAFKVDMPRLRKILCGWDKLPLDFACERQYLQLPSYERRHSRSEFIGGLWRVTVHPSLDAPFRLKHRVSVQCACNRWIPAGRLHQHVGACKHFSHD
jgi:hypothetical protein